MLKKDYLTLDNPFLYETYHTYFKNKFFLSLYNVYG